MCTSIAVDCFFACKIGDFGKTGDCLFTKISIMHTKLLRWQCKYYIVYSNRQKHVLFLKNGKDHSKYGFEILNF